MAFLPKLVITDIDGVWTDGGMFYDERGNEWKKFNTSDSAGVLFLRLLNIPLVIITGENSTAVKNRAQKLKIEHCYVGIRHKLQTAREVCRQQGVELKDVAMIGDDINDILLLREVGYSASFANAPVYIRKEVDFITQKRGGEGAFREFVEHLLAQNELLEKALELYLASKS